MDYQIINNVDIKVEKQKNKQIRQRVVLGNVVLQVLKGTVIELFVYYAVMQIQKQQLLQAFNVAWSLSNDQVKLIQCVLGVVLAVYFITSFFNHGLQYCTRQELIDRKSSYSDKYLATLEVLNQSEIVGCYPDKEKKGVIWFDYSKDSGVIKRMGMELQLAFQKDLTQAQVDLDKQMVSLPYHPENQKTSQNV